MTRRLMALSSLVVLSACAAVEPKPFRTPDGQTAYGMECSGMGRTLDACYRKADELCPRGFIIVGGGTEIYPIPVHHGYIVAPYHSLAVQCREFPTMQ